MEDPARMPSWACIAAFMAEPHIFEIFVAAASRVSHLLLYCLDAVHQGGCVLRNGSVEGRRG